MSIKFLNIIFSKPVFIILFLFISISLNSIIFKSIYYSDNIIIDYDFSKINVTDIMILNNIKKIYIIFNLISKVILLNLLYNLLFSKIFDKLKTIFENNFKKQKILENSSITNLSLLVGKTCLENKDVCISESGLYQNILVTGTTGCGKTSSAMYPFSRQLIAYESTNPAKRLGILVLDVKGNFYKEIEKYADSFNRKSDFLILELGKNIKYNPLNKPNLKPLVLANRLKTILTLFSTNNSDSYWLDKTEQILAECIKLCRLYNNGYVNFIEIHKLINIENYYTEKIGTLRNLFHSGMLSPSDLYDLSSSLDFFETEYKTLDSRVLSIIKSEITRITSAFTSDLYVKNTFCPEKLDISLDIGDVVNNGKILVLNMNISEYRNLSKIIATYLKLDFQTEVMNRLSADSDIRPVAFVCDEYNEYVTSTDAEFFAQSREAKCINIVATQSYNSLLTALKDESTVRTITQNLINKLWFRTDDIFTIEEIQKQIGKEDKQKISTSISENAKETNFNYFSNKLKSMNSSISESVNTYSQTDYILDTKFFTQDLKTFECFCFLSDGNLILPPCKLNLIPYFKNIQK